MTDQLSPEEKRAAEEKERWHNTRRLLKQYRRVVYSVKISEEEMNQRMTLEHGTKFSALEINAELAGVDLSGTKLENYARNIIQSKNMIEIVDNALRAVREEPEHGDLMYRVLYLTFFSPTKPRNREEILLELERSGYPMCLVTYHAYLNMAIRAIDSILWGYTARDYAEIVDQFLPEGSGSSN